MQITNYSSHSDHIEIQALREIGENLPAVIGGNENLLEILMKEDMLSKIFTQSLGIGAYLDEVARVAHQISHRYPHLNVLEIGKCTKTAFLLHLSSC